MQTRFNQSWYGKRAKVIRDNKDYCVIDYGCKGKGIISNYNLFDGIQKKSCPLKNSIQI